MYLEVNEPRCPLNFCTTCNMVVIKLLMWSLNYWRGYWTVVWSLNYWHGYWSVGWSLNWLYFLSCAHKTQKNERRKEKGFQCPKDEPPLKEECCKSFSWFIRYQTINEENTEHPLPLYWSTRVNWIRCGNYSKPGSSKLTNHSNNLKNGSTACN